MKKIIGTIILLGAAAVAFAEWHPASTGGKQIAAASVACSADGKTVYAADLLDLWKSEDGGATWTKVTPKEK